ncbi:MAG TPA: ATP-dependent sacrificial sulfur transferase LarE [bacterium]|nr:ATP-dependent sacrificial sulfur transferase LarE [bacterium]
MTALIRLKNILQECERVIVAFSGGVDSTLVLRAAHDALGDQVLAVTGRSPSVPSWEIEEAIDLARSFGVAHRLLDTEELARPEYVRNAPDRCYHCKTELFERLAALAREENYRWVVDGTNLDDLGDHRPGMRARREQAVRSPLIEAKLTKEDVRACSREYGLPTAEKPAFACLASRFPYGTPVTLEGLKRVEAAEKVVRDLGFRQFRVRHHDDVARLELEPADLTRALDPGVRARIVRGLRDAGYRYVSLDLEGYRSGSLNEVLPATIHRRPERL